MRTVSFRRKRPLGPSPCSVEATTRPWTRISRDASGKMLSAEASTCTLPGPLELHGVAHLVPVHGQLEDRPSGKERPPGPYGSTPCGIGKLLVETGISAVQAHRYPTAHFVCAADDW